MTRRCCPLRGFGDKESLNETLNQMKKIIKKVMLDTTLIFCFRREICVFVCDQRFFIYPSYNQAESFTSIRREEKNPNFNTFYYLATKTKRVSKHRFTCASAYYILRQKRVCHVTGCFFTVLFMQHQTTRDRFRRSSTTKDGRPVNVKDRIRVASVNVIHLCYIAASWISLLICGTANRVVTLQTP
jgi:hypothetical protein